MKVYELLSESDDAILLKAAKEVINGANIKEIAIKYKLTVGELRGEVGLVKDHMTNKRDHLVEIKESTAGNK